MFKSIEYKLYFYIFLLILSVALTTYWVMVGLYVYCMLSGLLLVFSVQKLYATYNKFNKNILFLLNALDNGDYSFNFSETKISLRERELNRMMNRIKEILSKARQETIESEKFQSLIVESVSTGIIILDHNDNVLIVNNAATQALGLPVLTHLNQLKVLNPDYPDMFRRLEVGENKQITVTNEREETSISLRVSTIKMKKGVIRIVSLNNIGSELEAKEMESWIRLIRVMTHEIMNSIAPITSLTDTLLHCYTADDTLLSQSELKSNTIEALDTINHTATGLINFVNSYRRFTSIPKPHPVRIPAVELVEKIVSLELPLLQEQHVGVEIVSRDKSVMLNADVSQITQVLVNLIKNALEAIASDSLGGAIRIRVSAVKNNVQIDVCNNGDPIPEDLLPNIFIPFFTTKETGTGIGLSVSRYIMRLHGGNLKHHYADGWTIFSMLFPN